MVEDLYTTSSTTTTTEMGERVERMFEACARVSSLPYWKSKVALLDMILASPNSFEVYLTEAHDVPSVAIVLGALCACGDQARILFASPMYSRFAFALLAESIMRSCRAHVRSEGGSRDSAHHIRSILGMRSTTDSGDQKVVATWTLPLRSACARTNKILVRNYTNTSPQSIVGVLGFLEHMHTKSLITHSDKSVVVGSLVELFQDKSKTSMKQFLWRHLVPSSVPGEPVQPLRLFGPAVHLL